MSSKPSGVEYALVDYDAHDRTLYPTIYKHLGKLAIPFTESVVMVNLAKVHQVQDAFNQINKEASKRGRQPITFNITDTHPRKASELRERSIKAHNALTRTIGKRLLEKLDRAEKRFNAKTDDVEKQMYKQRLLIAAAKRDLDRARAVALLFLIEKDAAQAVEASQKIIDAQRKVWQDTRSKQRDEKKAAAEKDKPAKAAKPKKAPKAKASKPKEPKAAKAPEPEKVTA